VRRNKAHSETLWRKGLATNYAHRVIDQSVQCVDGRVHTNGLENFRGLLKCSVSGICVSVEPFHLFRYLDEQAYRFNNRKPSDGERFSLAASGVLGKRQTFDQLIGNVPPDVLCSKNGRGAEGGGLHLEERHDKNIAN
jgi:ISXO2-like transposase domain